MEQVSENMKDLAVPEGENIDRENDLKYHFVQIDFCQGTNIYIYQGTKPTYVRGQKPTYVREQNLHNMSGNKNLQMSGNICFEDCLENILRGRRDLKHNLQNWRWFWETIFRKGIVIVYQFLSMLNEIFQSVIRHIINYTRR